jgi:hypothetical protein
LAVRFISGLVSDLGGGAFLNSSGSTFLIEVGALGFSVYFSRLLTLE